MADISKIKIESGIYDIKDEVARKNAMKFPNFFISAFFSGYNQTETRLLRFYMSLDGIHFNATNFTAQGIYDVYASDVSLIYNDKNQTFYLAMTDYDENHDCMIATSKDFLNWEKHYIDLGYKQPHNDLHRWGPTLFLLDNGNMVLTICVEYAKNGDTPLFHIEEYTIKPDNTNLEKPTKIGTIQFNDTSSTSSYIDLNFMKFNDMYYAIVKNENTKQLELYLNQYIISLSSKWTLVKNSVGMPNMKLEAPSFCLTDTTVNIYSENYIIKQGMNLQQCKKRDFPNSLTYGMRFLETLRDDSQNDISNELYNAKHGNVLFITDNHAKQMILNNCQIGLNSYNAIEREERNLYLKSFKDYPIKNWNKLVIYPKTGWNLGDIEEDLNLEILNPYNERFAYFYFTDKKPRITISKINNQDSNIVLNVDNSLTNNFVIFDIERGRFLTKQKAIGLADITNLNTSIGSVTYLNGALRGNAISLEMIINITETTTNFVKIAEFPTFKPSVCKAFVNSNKSGLYAYIDDLDGRSLCKRK